VNFATCLNVKPREAHERQQARSFAAQ
jgi:hypothetical protein